MTKYPSGKSHASQALQESFNEITVSPNRIVSRYEA